MRFISRIFILTGLLSVLLNGKTIKWDKLKIGSLSNDACVFADFNNDGKLDIACAESWFEAPAWTKHDFRVNKQDDMMVAYDVDGDGWTDLVTGHHGYNDFHKNPGAVGGLWPLSVPPCIGNHSGNAWDIDGDGKARELLDDVSVPTTQWSEYVGGAWKCYDIGTVNDQYGSGVGDINMDGRMDIIRSTAWYEAPINRRQPNWIRHPIAVGALENQPNVNVQVLPFVERIHEFRNEVGQHGHTVQMYAYDVNKDGLNDIISSSGHRMGLTWDEQVKVGSTITFKQHIIDGSVSILHSLELVDIDNDGDMDIVTSNRWRGHGSQEDPFSEAPLFVAWYENRPEVLNPNFKPADEEDALLWKRHFITYGENIASGCDIGVGDYDKDGDMDLVVIAPAVEGRGGGPWLFINRLEQARVDEVGPGLGNTVNWKITQIDTHKSQTCSFGDMNGDGKPDIIGGDYWYESPTHIKHQFRTMTGTISSTGIGSMDEDAISEVMEVDGDGKLDFIAGSMKAGLVWYKNSGTGMWSKSVIDAQGNYETGGLWDIDGDGKKQELISSGNLGTIRWWEYTGGKWTSYLIANESRDLGAGVGDLNGDGRPDVIRPDAWYEAPVNPRTGQWISHPLAIGLLDDRPYGNTGWAPNVTPAGPDWQGRNPSGGFGHTAKIFVYDVDKDGKNDIITSSAHRVGISWWKQKAGFVFDQQVIDADWSQAHALEFADVDGDGDPDLITGKNFKGGDGNDPMEEGDLVLKWYELRPGMQYPWVKHTISKAQIGAGQDMGVGDYDGDGDLDIVVTGKNGGPWLVENLLKNSTAILPKTTGAMNKRGRRLEFDGSKLVIVKSVKGIERATDVRGKLLWIEKKSTLLKVEKGAQP